MTEEQVNQRTNSVTIGPLVAQALELTHAYPLASRGAIHALSLALVVVFRSDYTVLAAGIALGLFGVSIGWDRYRNRAPEPEPEDDPMRAERWFLGVCRHACVPEPLVLRDWPTENGHAFELLVTANLEPDELGIKRPMTVARFISFAALLRDCAGLGCRNVHIEADLDNGGRCTAYVNGVRFYEWVPDPEPEPLDPTTELPNVAPLVRLCSIKGCELPPTTHVVTPDLPNLWVCDVHVDPTNAHLGGGLDCHPYGDECEQRTCIETPEPDESDKERTPDSDPLLPQRIHGEGPREGSEALPPPVLATRRPPGSEPGTRGGAMFDLLASAGGPLRRGTLAQAAGLSPTTVDKLLTAWADLGAATKVGSLWVASPHYTTSASILANGREETTGE